jgi:phosphatidate cytidylyltransferase
VKTRIVLGVTMLLVVAGLFACDAWLGSYVAISSLVSAVGVLAWCEFAALSGVGSRERGGNVGLFLVGFSTTAYLVALGWLDKGFPHLAAYVTGGVLGGLFAAFAVCVFRENHRECFPSLLATFLGSTLYGLSFSFLLRVYRQDEGLWLGVFFLLGVKGNDIVAYFTGRFFGRHRILYVSPKKTLEGCLGAVVFSVAWFSLGGALRPDLLFPWSYGIPLGIILSIATQVGDLSESLIKRYYSVKDSGALLPEFGGILDLTDSFLFTGFLFWVCVGL